MSLTTSYFGKKEQLEGTKISIARYTIKSNEFEKMPYFAPSENLLKRYKNNEMSWKKYLELYMKEQKEHFKKNPEHFKNLLNRARLENIILLCYEKFEGRNTKCHRLLLIDILKKVSQNKNIEVKFIEEI